MQTWIESELETSDIGDKRLDERFKIVAVSRPQGLDIDLALYRAGAVQCELSIDPTPVNRRSLYVLGEQIRHETGPAPVAVGKWVNPSQSVVERSKYLVWVRKAAILYPAVAIVDEDA